MVYGGNKKIIEHKKQFLTYCC